MVKRKNIPDHVCHLAAAVTEGMKIYILFNIYLHDLYPGIEIATSLIQDDPGNKDTQICMHLGLIDHEPSGVPLLSADSGCSHMTLPKVYIPQWVKVLI
jgi:hypothetical protein